MFNLKSIVYLFLLCLTIIACETNSVSIHTNTERVVLGDNIDIYVDGLLPNEKYLIHLQRLRDKQILYSYAEFQANETGEISVDHFESLAGSYQGKDSIGLFTMLDEDAPPNYLKKASAKEGVDHFLIQVSLHEKVLAEKKIERINTYSEEIQHNINEGDLKVNVHEVEGSDKLVIVFGGSEGNNYFSDGQAYLFAAKGYSSAAISYFGGENQYKTLLEIPLELIDSSMVFIENSIGKKEDIYIMGTSRGAELALLYASLHDNIDGVFAIAPSSYVFQGLSFSQKSAWIYRGEPYPFVTLPNTVAEKNENGAPIYTPVFLLAIDSASEESEIRIENIQGDVLLFSGKDDLLWPSALMADKLEERARNKGFGYKLYNYQYENAGHNISPPSYTSQQLYTFSYVLGGSFKVDAEAKADVWNKIIGYLENK